MTKERYLPIACLAFFAVVALGARMGLQLLRQGSTGVALFRSGRRDQNAREALFLLVAAVLAAHAAAPLVSPELLAPISLAPARLAWPLEVAGAILVVGATALMFAAQVGLGASWRIGIEEGARPGLVRTGFYAFSRNPIYLFLIVAVVGLLLLVPTWITLAAVVVSVALVRLQVRAEEDYLERAYGEEFRDYARHVGRFLPFLGRSR
ncbi:isoprenylcysteine carboxylmethyltransferase family protein [bacterium]|nr:isoprenylcysteine carboxylmethyltransferase family protein [bacterium]